jgi:hypothetical protein
MVRSEPLEVHTLGIEGVSARTSVWDLFYKGNLENPSTGSMRP